MKSFSVRLTLKDGKYQLLEGNPMYRFSESKNDWVEASETDREKLKKQFACSKPPVLNRRSPYDPPGLKSLRRFSVR